MDFRLWSSFVLRYCLPGVNSSISFQTNVIRFVRFWNILWSSKQKPLWIPLEFSGLFYCSVIKELVRRCVSDLISISCSFRFVKNFFNFFSERCFGTLHFSIHRCDVVFKFHKIIPACWLSNPKIFIRISSLFSFWHCFPLARTCYIITCSKRFVNNFLEFFLFSNNCLQLCFFISIHYVMYDLESLLILTQHLVFVKP